MMSSENTSLA